MKTAVSAVFGTNSCSDSVLKGPTTLSRGAREKEQLRERERLRESAEKLAGPCVRPVNQTGELWSCSHACSKSFLFVLIVMFCQMMSFLFTKVFCYIVQQMEWHCEMQLLTTLLKRRMTQMFP